MSRVCQRSGLFTKRLHYRAHQGSVLRPILFTLCIQPLSEVTSQSRCGHQKFADDTQLHQSSTPSDFHSLVVNVEQCGKKLSEEQASFRARLLNCRRYFTLILLIQKGVARWKGKVSVAFVDYLKAFDTVDRHCLWLCLSSVGLSNKLLNIPRKHI